MNSQVINNALFVDSSKEGIFTLQQGLLPELQFSTSHGTCSLEEAFSRHVSFPYQVCFVSSTLGEDILTFIKDIQILGRDSSCVFIQVTDQELGVSPQVPYGFKTIISRKTTLEDKEAIYKALNFIPREIEVKRKSLDLQQAAILLLREIDREAQQRKRGRAAPLNKLAQGLISSYTQSDPELLQNYYNALIELTQQAVPAEPSALVLPEGILDRDLPGLGSDGYSGVSHRVWEMLLDKFGESK